MVAERGAWRAFLPVVLVTGLSYLPACDLLHRCGCRAPWSGADADCDVHLASGPHCPWCEHWALGGPVLFAICGGQLLVFRARQRSGASPLSSAAASLAALPPLVLLVGALAWLPTDYPHFIVRGARERLGLPSGPIPCVAGSRSARSAHAVDFDERAEARAAGTGIDVHAGAIRVDKGKRHRIDIGGALS